MRPILFKNIFIQLLSQAKISGEEKIVVHPVCVYALAYIRACACL